MIDSSRDRGSSWTTHATGVLARAPVAAPPPVALPPGAATCRSYDEASFYRNRGRGRSLRQHVPKCAGGVDRRERPGRRSPPAACEPVARSAAFHPPSGAPRRRAAGGHGAPRPQRLPSPCCRRPCRVRSRPLLASGRVAAVGRWRALRGGADPVSGGRLATGAGHIRGHPVVARRRRCSVPPSSWSHRWRSRVRRPPTSHRAGRCRGS